MEEEARFFEGLFQFNMSSGEKNFYTNGLEACEGMLNWGGIQCLKGVEDG